MLHHNHACFLHVQVFDIVLNTRHKVVSNLDIFAKVGKAMAHDEVTKFTIENGQLVVGDQVSDFDGTLTVEFSKVNSAYIHPKGPGSEYPSVALQ